MRNPFFPGVGGVLSADIAVPEHEREVSFYSQILTTGSDPLWREDLMNNRGMPVIGLGQQSPEFDKLPLQWMPHFQVEDVGTSADCALKLGGSELMHEKNERGQSQWAVLADPDGAAFGIIPVVEDKSSIPDQNDRIGRISWLTLAVRGVSAICRFYEQVIDCETDPTSVDGEYDLISRSGASVAAINEVTGENQSVPTVWILHLPVDDLKESLRLVREGGGEIIKGSVDGGCVTIRDPLGVYLALQIAE